MQFDRLALVQWFAIITMALDHLAVVGVLPEWVRLLGRFALPAFVLMVAHNAYHADDPLPMLRRVLWLLLLSQPLWWLALGHWDLLCILVTLTVVVALVWACRVRRFDLAALVVVGFVAASPWIEGGVAPLLLVPLVLLPGLPTLALALVWPFAQYGLSPWSLAALFSLLLLAVLMVPDLVRFRFNVPRAPRWLTRYFYPAHLGALALVPLVVEVFP